MTGTPSRRQLRCCEAGWEGSPRQTPGPRNTNRIRRAPLGKVATVTKPDSHPERWNVHAAGMGGRSHVLPREGCPYP